MTVHFTQSYPIGEEGWHYEWISTESEPTYYEYVDGVLMNVSTSTTRDLWLAPGEVVQFEVLDSPSVMPQPAYPSRAWLSWYADTLEPAASYRIEELIDAEWVTAGTVFPGVGQTYFTWLSRVLEDDNVHHFRIVPVAFNKEEGLPLRLVVPMVRRPDPPAWSGTYDDNTGNLTVTVA